MPFLIEDNALISVVLEALAFFNDFGPGVASDGRFATAYEIST